MIRHIVLVRFRHDVADTERTAIFAALARLQDEVPGITGFTAGRSLELEGLEHGFLHGFVVEFADRAALDAYQQHPRHREAGARLVAALEGGPDGLLVFDLEN